MSQTRDAELTFGATIIKADGSVLTHETPNRTDYLAWVDAQCLAIDSLVVTIQARGPAAWQMLGAIELGARNLNGQTLDPRSESA